MLGHGSLGQLPLGSTQTSAAPSGYTLTCNSGTYAVAGQSAVIKRDLNLAAQAGTYSVTGQSAAIKHDRSLTASSGTYSVTGQSATITKASPGAYSITCQAGTYTLTGQSITITKSSNRAGGGYEDKKKKKYIVKAGDRLLVFTDELSALNALPQEPVKQYPAKKTKKADSKRIEPLQSIQTSQPDTSVQLAEIARLASIYAQQQAYRSYLEARKYEALINLFEDLKRQEDEDDELLLLAA